MGNVLGQWHRGPRATFNLTTEPGVYTLFLKGGARLPGIALGEAGLIYIGMAANRNGLKGRCHFKARTRNHSPRKSLSVLLMDELALVPVLVPKPNSQDTWGLDPASEVRLSAWMHANLELAVEVHLDPDARESELVQFYAPPLNLSKCAQSPQHRQISQARCEVLRSLQRRCEPPSPSLPITKVASQRIQRVSEKVEAASPVQSKITRRPPVGAKIDAAEAIAARYGLNPNSYRQRLRDAISWYRKPQEWALPMGSREWQDMIAVAEGMTRAGW